MQIQQINKRKVDLHFALAIKGYFSYTEKILFLIFFCQTS